MKKIHCAIHKSYSFNRECPRCAKGEGKPLSVQEQIESKLDMLKRQKQEAKELRWATRGTLGELTEKYINQGDSEDGAYNQARQECGLD